MDDDDDAPQGDDGQEPDPIKTLLRVFRAFMIPFLLSWALAFIGSNREIEWLYYTGLGGVGLSTTALLVWLIH